MGAAIAHSDQQAKLRGHFISVFDAFLGQFEGSSVPFFDCSGNMDPQIHTKIQEQPKYRTSPDNRALKKSKTSMSVYIK